MEKKEYDIQVDLTIGTVVKMKAESPEDAERMAKESFNELIEQWMKWAVIRSYERNVVTMDVTN
jgi:hypothetical protein